jgi:hypothetical protein
MGARSGPLPLPCPPEPCEFAALAWLESPLVTLLSPPLRPGGVARLLRCRRSLDRTSSRATSVRALRSDAGVALIPPGDRFRVAVAAPGGAAPLIAVEGGHFVSDVPRAVLDRRTLLTNHAGRLLGVPEVVHAVVQLPPSSKSLQPSTCAVAFRNHSPRHVRQPRLSLGRRHRAPRALPDNRSVRISRCI